MHWRPVAHLIFETLGYAAGFRLYLRARRGRDFLSAETRAWIVIAAIFGAFAGSKILFLLEDPARTLAMLRQPLQLLSGKTIVGGLLGGTFAVEWTKARLHIMRRTGDVFAIPLTIGIAIGRIGCFFGGLEDDTYGIATGLPWGVAFGDGIRRHPTQLYESLCMVGLAWILHKSAQRPHREGALYRGFLMAYLAWRLFIDFWKPGIAFAGLTSIQWACAAGLLWYIAHPIREEKHV